jgi:hypothetical protein
MKTKIILLLVISSLITGCVGNSIEKQNTSSKNIISESYQGITNKFENECGTTLTTAQCDDWVENHINGNYVRWKGVIVDVRNDVVYVAETSATDYSNVALYDVSKEELMKLNPKENIVFTGKINLKKDPTFGYKGTWDDSINLRGTINLYDATIIGNMTTGKSQSNAAYVTSDGAIIRAILTPTPISTPASITKSSGIQYYIDTSPPGGGIVYINDKISPTTGTLSPGSYTFSLEIGGQVYAFPTTSLNEGHPKVEIIVGKDKITCSICQ